MDERGEIKEKEGRCERGCSEKVWEDVCICWNEWREAEEGRVKEWEGGRGV